MIMQTTVPIRQTKRYSLSRSPEGMSLAKMIFAGHADPRRGYLMAVVLPILAYCVAFAIEDVTEPVSRLMYLAMFFGVQVFLALIAGARTAIIALTVTNMLIFGLFIPRHPQLHLATIAVVNLIWLGMIWVGHHSRQLIMALKASQDELQERERRNYLMVQELNHRVKNTLAQTQAIVTMTKRNSVSVEDYHKKVIERLLALSHTHNLLTDANWGTVNFRRLLATELDVAQHMDEITTQGPDLQLSPKIALALGLALHELITNAQKYGALSEAGHLDIRWHVHDRNLVIVWNETTRHVVTAPDRHGFGSRLIRQCIQADLGGSIDKHFAPDGLKCRIEVPLHSYETGSDFF